MSNINEKIRARFFELQDEKFREFSSSLCNTSDCEMIGVRTPQIRNMAKELAKENIDAILKYDDIKYYEDMLLRGFIIGVSKISIEDTFRYLEEFIPRIDNWAVCDSTCASLKITKKNMEEMWKFIQKYIKADGEYEKRFAIVMYLDYFIDDKYIKKIFNQIEKISDDRYYVKMAVAWFLATAYAKFPVDTMEFLKKTNIDNWTYNKAIQKMIESYRVSDGDKAILRKMKK